MLGGFAPGRHRRANNGEYAAHCRRALTARFSACGVRCAWCSAGAVRRLPKPEPAGKDHQRQSIGDLREPSSKATQGGGVLRQQTSVFRPLIRNITPAIIESSPNVRSRAGFSYNTGRHRRCTHVGRDKSHWGSLNGAVTSITTVERGERPCASTRFKNSCAAHLYSTHFVHVNALHLFTARKQHTTHTSNELKTGRRDTPWQETRSTQREKHTQN